MKIKIKYVGKIWRDQFLFYRNGLKESFCSCFFFFTTINKILNGADVSGKSHLFLRHVPYVRARRHDGDDARGSARGSVRACNFCNGSRPADSTIVPRWRHSRSRTFHSVYQRPWCWWDIRSPRSDKSRKHAHICVRFIYVHFLLRIHPRLRAPAAANTIFRTGRWSIGEALLFRIVIRSCTIIIIKVLLFGSPCAILFLCYLLIARACEEYLFPTKRDYKTMKPNFEIGWFLISFISSCPTITDDILNYIFINNVFTTYVC